MPPARALTDPILAHVEGLHACFHGAGTDERELTRIIVSRSEVSPVSSVQYGHMFILFLYQC